MKTTTQLDGYIFQSTKQDQLTAALAGALADMPPVNKSHDMKTGNKINFYATLDDMLDALIPSLSSHRITLRQSPTSIDGQYVLMTRIDHAISCQFFQLLTPLEYSADPHTAAKNLTYCRKSVIKSLFAFGFAEPGLDDNTRNNAPSSRKKRTSAKMRHQQLTFLANVLELPVDDSRLAPTSGNSTLDFYLAGALDNLKGSASPRLELIENVTEWVKNKARAKTGNGQALSAAQAALLDEVLDFDAAASEASAQTELFLRACSLIDSLN